LTLYDTRATINETPSAIWPTNPTGPEPRLQTVSTFMAWKPFGRCRLLVCLGFLALAGGCQEQEQIRSYKAPHESMPEPAATRMLAVMAPHGKDVWFFKFVGPKKEVSEHEGDFESVIHSARFQDQEDAPLTWTNPPGWKREAGPRPRYATLRLGRKGEGLEITVTNLGPEASDVRKNVDRWRDQLGLDPLTDEQFRALLDNTEMGGAKATKVDLVGVLKEEAAPMMGRPPRERPKASTIPFKYATPDGWELRPAVEKQGVRTPLVLRIAADGSEAEATAMPLPADGGGLGFNVNRWQRQAGLPPVSDEQIRRDARVLKVGDQDVVYVDISGPGLGMAKRILGAIVPHGKKETWFFTLKGPPDLVGKEQSHFEAFVKSVRFDGEAGAAHE
jgi:hypothetical protein